MSLDPDGIGTVGKELMLMIFTNIEVNITEIKQTKVKFDECVSCLVTALERRNDIKSLLSVDEIVSGYKK